MVTIVVRIANDELQKFGAVRQLDTSLTTAENQTEYDIPIAIKGKVLEVWIQSNADDSNDNKWIPVEKTIIPAAEGSVEKLVLPQYVGGYTIGILWEGLHSNVHEYDDVISEYIPRDAAVAACCLAVARSKSVINPDLLPKLTQMAAEARILSPVKPHAEKVNGFPHWS